MFTFVENETYKNKFEEQQTYNTYIFTVLFAIMILGLTVFIYESILLTVDTLYFLCMQMNISHFSLQVIEVTFCT